jgi:glycosyltransferase involved in cell wall biosynthesis
MKILEAASYGVPVVSTYVGAEGLMLREGKDILLADNPDLFIQYILKLENEDYRKRLSENLQNSIASIYSVEALLENRKELYI